MIIKCLRLYFLYFSCLFLSKKSLHLPFLVLSIPYISLYICVVIKQKVIVAILQKTKQVSM